MILTDEALRKELSAKNEGIKNFEVGSKQIVWWECDKGHKWEARVQHRINGTGCPICKNRVLLKGFNDLQTNNPSFLKDWHPTKNGSLTPSDFMFGSISTVWWLGECGHEWEAKISNRQRGDKCPYCTGKRILIGFNDLASVSPQIVKEWHPTKNGTLTPQDFVNTSNKKMWWICSQGHEWNTAISHRTSANPTGCPYCVNQKVLPGYNDFETKHPSLIKEWDFKKNSSRPSSISSESGLKAWWICKAEGHSWSARIKDRLRGNKCPVCTNKKVVAGFNDLASTHPEIAKEWHPTKNNTPQATNISYGSEYKATWICIKEHEWVTTVSHRSLGQNCPICGNGISSSKAEKEISLYLEALGLQVEMSNRTVLNGKEIDIYLPEKKIGIEYNGLYWHSERAGKGKTYHYDKWLASKEAGVQLIQIWEDDWNRDKNIILNGLKHKLGLSNQEKVFARKTFVVNLTVSEAQDFLNTNHIQGFASGTYYLGLKSKIDDAVKAILVLKNEPGTDKKVLNIIRYATSANVVGGFTKLLQHAVKTYEPESFITFADHTVSDGGLYEKNGFIADKELAPDYMYIVRGERKHKFGYRLKRFENDPELLWEEGLTERELAELNGLDRIWDAGKTRYRFVTAYANGLDASLAEIKSC